MMTTAACTEIMAAGPGNVATAATPGSKADQERADKDGKAAVHPKRSTRQRKKRQLKAGRLPRGRLSLLDVPFDILFQIFTLLRPSEVFRLSRTCRSLHAFLLHEHPGLIARSIVRWRYSCLEQCLRLPVPITDVDHEDRDVLQDQNYLKLIDLHNPDSHQNVKPPNPSLVCTCLSCLLRWKLLCLAVDLAHWQVSLDASAPMPVIPKGEQPKWNRKLLDVHSAVVEKAVSPCIGGIAAPLWHAAILEAHLDSTVRAICRHNANKSNKRKRFRMTAADAATFTDEFLKRKGPPLVTFPTQRDRYHLLEVYLPNRNWLWLERRWEYMPDEQHEIDLMALKKWVMSKRAQAALEAEAKQKAVDDEEEAAIGSAT